MDEKRLLEIEALVFEGPGSVPLAVSMELAKEVRRLREALLSIAGTVDRIGPKASATALAKFAREAVEEGDE